MTASPSPTATTILGRCPRARERRPPLRGMREPARAIRHRGGGAQADRARLGHRDRLERRRRRPVPRHWARAAPGARRPRRRPRPSPRAPPRSRRLPRPRPRADPPLRRRRPRPPSARPARSPAGPTGKAGSGGTSASSTGARTAASSGGSSGGRRRRRIERFDDRARQRGHLQRGDRRRVLGRAADDGCVAGVRQPARRAERPPCPRLHRGRRRRSLYQRLRRRARGHPGPRRRVRRQPHAADGASQRVVSAAAEHSGDRR